ncbi:deaminase domain-containing protein [Streptomyces sp. NPDC015238]
MDPYSEREVCDSCRGLMDQFKKAFPGIEINITWGVG